MVEVLGGFAKAVEAGLRPAPGRVPLRLGWLTPLLGVYVMLDLTSFWLAVWIARDQFTVAGPLMLGGLVFAGSYYLAAHAVFPSDPAAHDELDSHYFRVRRVVFGILFVLLAVQLAYWLSVPALRVAFSDPWLCAILAAVFALIGAAMLVRSRAASIVLLAVLIAQYLYDYIGEPILIAIGVTA